MDWTKSIDWNLIERWRMAEDASVKSFRDDDANWFQSRRGKGTTRSETFVSNTLLSVWLIESLNDGGKICPRFWINYPFLECSGWNLVEKLPFSFSFFLFSSINWQEINFDIQILVLSIEPRLNERTKRGKIIFVIFLRKTEMIAILLQLINL